MDGDGRERGGVEETGAQGPPSRRRGSRIVRPAPPRTRDIGSGPEPGTGPPRPEVLEPELVGPEEMAPEQSRRAGWGGGMFGPRTFGGGRVQVYGCSPGCLVASLAASVLLTLLLNLLIGLF